jgi:predicted RNA binding protein YcfA (HicA-like mRNA interferase family)
VSSKDTEQLLDELRSQGFEVRVGGSGHYRVKSPAGRTTTIPKTPATRRSLRNTRAALRRIGAVL